LMWKFSCPDPITVNPSNFSCEARYVLLIL
jgi:hypothetical protein